MRGSAFGFQVTQQEDSRNQADWELPRTPCLPRCVSVRAPEPGGFAVLADLSMQGGFLEKAISKEARLRRLRRRLKT